MQPAPHSIERQKTKEEKVTQREEQLFGKRDRDLPRHPAGQLRARLREEGGKARSGIRRELQIGVDEYEEWLRGGGGELGAGEIFPAPTGREVFTRDQVQARRVRRDLPNDLGRAIGRAVVKHEDFHRATAECGADRALDVFFLVPGWDENRRALRGRAGRRAQCRKQRPNPASLPPHAGASS